MGSTLANGLEKAEKHHNDFKIGDDECLWSLQPLLIKRLNFVPLINVTYHSIRQLIYEILKAIMYSF